MPEAETSADPITAALAQIRDRGYENGAHGARCARLSDAAAEDVPRLLAALEAVLGNHAALAEGGPTGGAWCPTCWRIWPCETYKAIARELLGEEASRG